MSGTWDADILSVCAVDDGGSFAVDIVGSGAAFDILATIRIGENLMQFVDQCELFVSVRNLSRCTAIASRHQTYPLAPQKAPLNDTLRVRFGAGWDANEGEVLEVMGTFKVTSGVNCDYSLARSDPFVVCS